MARREIPLPVARFRLNSAVGAPFQAVNLAGKSPEEVESAIKASVGLPLTASILLEDEEGGVQIAKNDLNGTFRVYELQPVAPVS